MYLFNHLEKPRNASKTYYTEKIVGCLKTCYKKARTEATFQSIDESMVKFKGRSALKQYRGKSPLLDQCLN